MEDVVEETDRERRDGSPSRPLLVDVVTVFPGMLGRFLDESIVARARNAGRAEIRLVDLRDFSRDQRRTVDDKPYSGGPGMLMKPDVWYDAIENCLSLARARGVKSSRVVMTTPTGTPYSQAVARSFAESEHIVVVCGHYEGVDDRVGRLVTDEISMGDFVLTGGEIPAAAIVDSTVRLLPGVLGGGVAATARESFGEDGLLEAPQYTRPASFRGMEVPAELVGGDHAKADAWRRHMAYDLTSRNRPDLLETRR